MGKIKKFLAGELIEKRYLSANEIWTDLCENVHLHYRNIRIDFSEKEFATFRAAINMLGRAVEKCAVENEYEEGDTDFLIQQVFNHSLNTDSDYYPDRVTLERQKDNTIHFHYRDLRLHLTESEFILLADMFALALKEFKAENHSGKIPLPDKATEMLVPIKWVNPYDEGHKPLAINKEHRQGIDFIKEEIKLRGRHAIRPILVNPAGQRLDGFKRYMAFKELEFEYIPCLVDPFGVVGGQKNQSHLKDKD